MEREGTPILAGVGKGIGRGQNGREGTPILQGTGRRVPVLAGVGEGIGRGGGYPCLRREWEGGYPYPGREGTPVLAWGRGENRKAGSGREVPLFWKGVRGRGSPGE